MYYFSDSFASLIKWLTSRRICSTRSYVRDCYESCKTETLFSGLALSTLQECPDDCAALKQVLLCAANSLNDRRFVLFRYRLVLSSLTGSP